MVSVSFFGRVFFYPEILGEMIFPNLTWGHFFFEVSHEHPLKSREILPSCVPCFVVVVVVAVACLNTCLENPCFGSEASRPCWVGSNADPSKVDAEMHGFKWVKSPQFSQENGCTFHMPDKAVLIDLEMEFENREFLFTRIPSGRGRIPICSYS